METNALGHDPIPTLFTKLTIPAVVAQVVNLLYNIIDRMYIGHIPTTGPIALTGVGVSMPIIVIISAFAVLIGAGGAPRASMALGAGEKEKANAILNTAFTATIVLGLILTALGLYFKKTLLLKFGASEQSLPHALDYISIYLLGTPALMISLGLNSFIAAQGFAKTSMKTTMIGAGLNIILDPIFIFALNMGVKGAALATIISQFISCLWVLVFLSSQKTVLRINIRQINLAPQYLGPIIALGISPFIMQSTESLLQIVFNISLAKYGGDLYVGTMAINAIFMQLTFLPLIGITQGATPLISYNYGAKAGERVREAISTLVKVCLVYTIVLGLILQIFPPALISLFTKDQALMEATKTTLRIYSAGFFLLGIQVACQQSFIAFGQAKISVFLALLRKIILLIPLIYILPQILNHQVHAVYMAEPIADILAATVTGIMFYQFMKKTMAEMKRENKNRPA